MTYEEALKEIKYQEDMRSKGIDYQVNNLVVAKIVEALEKQIPKKPFLKDLFELGTMQGTVCPNCEIVLCGKEKYCSRCGQALDWSDTE